MVPVSSPTVQTQTPLPARTAWREAVATVAEKAKAALPACNGRVAKAVALVLAGDVEILADGTALVSSQCHPTRRYHVNGTCECPDFLQRAPAGFCKHRLAYGIHKRAMALAQQQREQPGGPAIEQHTAAVQPLTLPEAPASVNVYVEIAGRKVQVTLRDQDEQRLLARLETLLQHFPAEAEASQEHPAGWCSTHGV